MSNDWSSLQRNIGLHLHLQANLLDLLKDTASALCTTELETPHALATSGFSFHQHSTDIFAEADAQLTATVTASRSLLPVAIFTGNTFRFNFSNYLHILITSIRVQLHVIVYTV